MSTQSPQNWLRRLAVLQHLRDFIAGRARRRFRRIVTKALTLTPRGFVPNDVLVLTKLSGQLQVEWLARDVHPWDRARQSDVRAEAFREQTLRDTDKSIVRFFELLPDIKAIDIRVCEPRTPHNLLLAGTVSRQDALANRSLSSLDMRLRMMGLRWFTDDHAGSSRIDQSMPPPPAPVSDAGRPNRGAESGRARQ